MNKFSNNISKVLEYSKEQAIRLSSNAIAPEHILLGILKEDKSILNELLLHNNLDSKNIEQALENKIIKDGSDNTFNDIMLNPNLDEQANNILKLAVLEARLMQNNVVDTDHIVLAILHDRSNNGAKEILEQNNIYYNDTVKYIQQKNHIVNGLKLSDDEESSETHDSEGTSRHSTTDTAHNASADTPILNNFSTDLTQAARDGKLDVVVGREKEIQRVIEILCRRKKNNPILIGEPGVGKSAIAEGLAQMIARRHTSPMLYNKRIVSLNMTAIVAGTKYRGQFEERIQALLKEIENNPDIIVFIDEIHTIIGAGSTPGSMDAANIMKPALARGVIQCIGATTLDEYRNSIEKDGALERRFQKILIEPTTPDQTLAILHNIKDRYEQHHNVTYTDEALEACVQLTERYVADRSFPDKAIDALDEVGAKVQIKNATLPPAVVELEKELKNIEEAKNKAVADQNFEQAASLRDKQTQLETQLRQINEQWTASAATRRAVVDQNDVAQVVAAMTGIPVGRLQESDNQRLRIMAEELKKNVVGQDEAIDKITRCIRRNRIGMRDPQRPIGVFMFLGPTGVGKTHLAKSLAELMFGTTDALIRIDMSEYSESFNTSRLVGAPPGYVGYESGGQLTERVRRHPYSIVLLDEIEKAHANVYNMLLQVLDDGRMTDGLGRTVDFRNTIIIMTSNTGTRELRELGRGVGFAHADGKDSAADKSRTDAILRRHVNKQFAPEFLNRLDDIITFDALNHDSLQSIVNIMIRQLVERIQNHGYKVEITPAVIDMLANKGYDSRYGARPLRRTIQNLVEDPLCALIINDKINFGDAITIDVNKTNDGVIINNSTLDKQ